MKFDQVLEAHVGSCGRYQRLLVLLLAVPSIFTAYIGEVIFSAGHMQHWCKVPQPQEGPAAHLDQEEWLNLTVPWVEADGHWERSQCQVYTNNVSYVTMSNNTQTASTCSSYEYDTSVFKSTIVSEWDIVCDKSYYISIIKSINLAGMGLGYAIGGIVSDRIGRKKTFVCSLLLTAAGRLAVIFSYNLPVFLADSFLTLMADVSMYASTFTLSLELVGPSWRAAVGALCPIAIAVGYMLLSATAYLCRVRQTLHIATTVPLLLLIPICWLVPESPRWLLDTGRPEEATKVLRTITRRNGRTWPDLVKLDAHDKLQNGMNEEKMPFLKSVKQIFTSRVLIVRVLINLLAWFTANMGYYGLTMNIQALAGSIYVNLAIAGALELVSVVIGPLMISSRLGRRGATCCLYLLSGVSLLLILAIPDNLKMVSTGLALFGRACCSAYFATFFIWTAELFPTSLRVSAISLSSAAGKIGGVLAPFLAELGRVSEVLPMIILGALSIGAGLLLLTLPETKGAVLPRTVDDMLKVHMASVLIVMGSVGQGGPHSQICEELLVVGTDNSKNRKGCSIRIFSK